MCIYLIFDCKKSGWSHDFSYSMKNIFFITLILYLFVKKKHHKTFSERISKTTLPASSGMIVKKKKKREQLLNFISSLSERRINSWHFENLENQSNA